MGDKGDKGMRKCGKSRYQICNVVEEGSSFNDGRGHMHHINYCFDSDSTGGDLFINLQKMFKNICGEYSCILPKEV